MARGFRLAGLLRLRTLQEEQAAAELERANAERRAAQKRRAETAELLGGASLPDRGDDLTWAASVAGRAALSGLVGEAALVVEATSARADHATAQWSAARTRVTALGKLEDRHDVAVRAEEERAEQVVLDEAAGRRHRTGDTHPLSTPGTVPTSEEKS